MRLNKLLYIAVSLLISCTANSPQQTAEKTEVSSCGGFPSLAKTTGLVYQQDSSDYCSAEKIRWLFDKDENSLEILHTRMLQNCAADLVVEVRSSTGGFEIAERNTSNSAARCMCYFDTYCKIPGVRQGLAAIVFNGRTFELDMDSINGTIVIDTAAGWPCR